MNSKSRTLIIAFITIAIVIAICDDLPSISAVLGLISFIMICHFYLNRHQEDVSTILQDYQSSLVDTMNIKQEALDPIQEPNIPTQQQSNQDNLLLQDTIKDPIKQVQQVMDLQGRIPPFTNRSKLTYLYEDNRINQLLERQRPLKDIQAHQKMIRNIGYFKNLFEDEIQFNLQRSGAWNDELRDDSDICR